MAAITTKVAFSFRDSQGRTSRMSVNVEYDPTTAGLVVATDNILAALAPCTNAAIQSITGQQLQPIVYGTNAAYASAQDKMVLQFQGTNGLLHRIEIGAPKLANFAVDGVTVLNTGISATLIEAIVVNCVDRDNNSLVYLSGWFRRAKNLRRTSSLVKIPAGTTQAVP